MTSGLDKIDNSQTQHLAKLTDGSQKAVDAVLGWLSTGAADASILEALNASFPDEDPNIIQAAVVDRLREEGTPDADAVRGWASLAYRELYRRMMEIGDFAGAIKAVKETVALTK